MKHPVLGRLVVPCSTLSYIPESCPGLTPGPAMFLPHSVHLLLTPAL